MPVPPVVAVLEAVAGNGSCGLDAWPPDTVPLACVVMGAMAKSVADGGGGNSSSLPLVMPTAALPGPAGGLNSRAPTSAAAAAGATTVTGVRVPPEPLPVDALGAGRGTETGTDVSAALVSPLEMEHAEEAANEEEAGSAERGGAAGSEPLSRKTVSRQMGTKELSTAFDLACVAAAKFSPFT